MVPLEVTDALLDKFHRLADRHERRLPGRAGHGGARHELTLSVHHVSSG
jgi:hypothetical protein